MSMSHARERRLARTFDDNQSVWLADKPAYDPLAALAGPTAADVAIIGGGFTGVSTALHLARRFPSRRIVMLEAKVLANGASGRNGGLMLNGMNAHAPNLEMERRIYEVTSGGIDAIAAMIRDFNLPVDIRRDGCLEVFTDARRADAAAAEVERLQGAFLPLRFLSGPELQARVRLRGAVGAVLDPNAGQIDGAALVRGLRPVLEGLGVAIYEQTPVIAVEEGSTLRLTTPGGEVRARAVVLATNAYTPQLGYFKNGICPVHSHVLATERMDPGAWEEIGWSAGTAGFSDDLDRIAYGAMTARGELVFGGGSNAAYAYEFGNSTRFRGDRGRAFEAIRRRLVDYLPGAERVRIAHRWSGPVALTMSRICTMGVMGEYRNIYYALGYSGHGITLANLAGRVLCDIYSDDDVRWRDLPFYGQRLHFIPPEPFRWLGYHAYTLLSGRSPRRIASPAARRDEARGRASPRG